jgi:hypothetical protein
MSWRYLTSVCMAGLFLFASSHGLFPKTGTLLVSLGQTPTQMIGGTPLCNGTDHKITSCQPLPGFTCNKTFKEGFAVKGHLTDTLMEQEWMCTQSGCQNLQDAWHAYVGWACTQNGPAPQNLNYESQGLNP